MKKIYKDRKNGKLCGVIAGFAKYVDIDVTVLRILFVLGVLITHIFPLVVAYVLGCLLMPESNDDSIIDGKVE